MSFEDTAVAITGAGSGLGRATAREFAERGADVVAVDIDEPGVTETVETIRDTPGPGAAIKVVADVSDPAAVAGFVDTTVREFGRIDVLHNNAGVAQESTPIEDVTEAEWDAIQAVNLKGPFLGIRHAVPHMRDQGGGVILNTASISGIRPRDGLSAYSTSKGGLITLTRQAAAELAADDIRVNAICPVAADTPMLAEFTDGLDHELVADAVTETIPLGRLSQPTDVANAATFLASDQAAMITGIALKIDGGRGI